MSGPDPLYPFPLFRFQVEFRRQRENDSDWESDLDLVRGAFAECTGLEATMEPKVIKAGGANFGAFQRPGPVSFATVILKRGVTTGRDLWKWFSFVNEQGKYAFRLDVKIDVLGDIRPAESPPDVRLTVRLFRALPVKFKCGDLNARATEVGIEELHLAHEGLEFL